MKTIVLDGLKLHNLATFYDEAYQKFSPDLLNVYVAGSLDGFDDILGGGFGAFEDNEPIKLMWKNSAKSKEDLGYVETILYLEKRLRRAYPEHKPELHNWLAKAKVHEGQTLFDILVDTIKEHDHIKLVLG